MAMYFGGKHGIVSTDKRRINRLRAHRTFVQRRTRVVTEALREPATRLSLELERIYNVAGGIHFLLIGQMFVDGLVVEVSYDPERVLRSSAGDDMIKRGHIVSAVGRNKLSNVILRLPMPVNLEHMTQQAISDLSHAVKVREENHGQDFASTRVLDLLQERHSLVPSP